MNDAAPVQTRMTVQDYLAFCDARPRENFQLLAGVPVAMAPATVRHEMIAANIDAILRPQLKPRGCRSHRDLGVALSENADYLPEPDVVVRCGPVDGSRRWVDDPLAVFEVLSPSTMVDDRGYKLREYFAFPSMRHVVLVYQEQVRVEHWKRGNDGAWQDLVVLQFAQDRLELSAVEASISVAEIYDGIAPG